MRKWPDMNRHVERQTENEEESPSETFLYTEFVILQPKALFRLHLSSERKLTEKSNGV